MYRRCGFRHEKKLRAIGVARIAGIDEAGRGALAGPVVAAAVILPEKFRHRKLNDSKQLAPELREEIYQELIANGEVTWAVGVVDHIEIDRINILRATHKAMRAAIEALMLVAKSGTGPTMLARIGVMQALNRQVERVFNPSRKETHWGAVSWPVTADLSCKEGRPARRRSS